MGRKCGLILAGQEEVGIGEVAVQVDVVEGLEDAQVSSAPRLRFLLWRARALSECV